MNTTSDKKEIIKAVAKGGSATAIATTAAGIISGLGMTTVTTAAPGIAGWFGLATVTATVANPITLTGLAIGGAIVGGTIAGRACYKKIKEVNDILAASQEQANQKKK